MKLCIATILLICFEHVTKAIAQGMPISPCPKIFQYRFDGNEWFGLIAVRNPDINQALQIRVTLTMRGKPTTSYLGEIELLTRGQFNSNAPVLYKIRFPKHNFPPKLLQISVNQRVICFGSGDHSIFMTQIQLEHIRKLTFISDQKTPSLIQPPAEPVKSIGKDSISTSTQQDFGSKFVPHIQFKKRPFHAAKEVCGTIDPSINFQVPSQQRTAFKQPTDNLRAADVNAAPIFASLSDYDSDDIDFEKEDAVTDIVDDTAASLLADGNNAATTTVDDMPSITRGAWPWLAAIYVNNLTSLDYQCGGTLVSARVVISSAHCFHMFNQRYTANEVLVFLGRYNLKNWNEEGSLAAPVNGIYIHADYNSQLSTYDADIAVIILKDEVRFNTFIRPACLWSGSSKTEYIVGEHGIVVGWSLDKLNKTAALKTTAFSTKTKTTTTTAGSAATDASIPKVLNAPIISNENCFSANAHFQSLSSNRTFCAGILTEQQTQKLKEISTKMKNSKSKSAGSFTGMSGAGLMINRNNRWMLRGTVSAALPTNNATSNRDQYIIYTDVAKFIDWLTAFII